MEEIQITRKNETGQGLLSRDLFSPLRFFDLKRFEIRASRRGHAGKGSWKKGLWLAAGPTKKVNPTRERTSCILIRCSWIPACSSNSCSHLSFYIRFRFPALREKFTKRVPCRQDPRAFALHSLHFSSRTVSILCFLPSYSYLCCSFSVHNLYANVLPTFASLNSLLIRLALSNCFITFVLALFVRPPSGDSFPFDEWSRKW